MKFGRVGTPMKKTNKFSQARQKKFDKHSIEKSLRECFFVIIFVFVIAIAIAMSGIGKMTNRLNTLAGTYMKVVDESWSARKSLIEGQNALYKMLLTRNAEVLEQHKAEMETCDQLFDENLEYLAKADESLEAKASQIKELNSQLESTEAEIQKLIMSGDTTNGAILLEETFAPLVDKINLILLEMSEVAEKSSMVFIAKSNIYRILTSAIMFIILFINIILAIVLSKMIIRRIVGPLSEVETAMSGMSQGNLEFELTYEADNELGQLSDKVRETGVELHGYINIIDETLKTLSMKDFDVSVDTEFKGMFDHIKQSLNAIITSLNAVMQTIQKTAVGVESGSQQIARVSQSLAEGALDQSSTVQELLATVQTVTEQVRTNAASVKEVSVKSTQAKNTVDDGNQKMDQLVEAMRDISESSKQISEILTVIEGISGQTNLLALNASIEAARAGEAGKGFAVVAAEIGELASKTKEATKTTETLINKSVNAVEIGNKLVEGTAELLHSVVDANTEINSLAEEVSAASATQAESLEEITNAVNQISSIVENNTSLAEETEASSSELNTHVEELTALINDFHLKK